MDDSPPAPRRVRPSTTAASASASASDREILEMRRLRATWRDLWNETGERMPLDQSHESMAAFMRNYVDRRLAEADTARSAPLGSRVRPHVMDYLKALESIGMKAVQEVANQVR